MKRTKTLSFCAAFSLVALVIACKKNETAAPAAPKTKSTVSFWNTTFATVALTFDGTQTQLNPGDSMHFVITADSSMSYSAVTSPDFGDTLAWGPVNIKTPSKGEQQYTLETTAGEYYLMVQNYSPIADEMRYLFVDSVATAWPPASPVPIYFANDSLVYGVGYFSSKNKYVYFATLNTVTSTYDVWHFEPTDIVFTDAPPLSMTGVNQQFLAILRGNGN